MQEALSKVTGLLLFALGDSRLGPCCTCTEIRGQDNQCMADLKFLPLLFQALREALSKLLEDK